MKAIERYIEERQDHSNPVCAYVYDLTRLEKHAGMIKETLPDFCSFFYAMKANPDRHLLKTLAPIIDGFDVASGGEIAKAAAYGKPMVFGAPGKKQSEIEIALEEGVRYINVESTHDWDRIAHLAEEKGISIPVLLRVNLSSDVPESHHMMSGVPSQFGMSEEDVAACIKQSEKESRVSIAGFHFHAMSNNLDAEAHVRFVQLCVEKADDWRRRYGLEASIIDIGGGIGINYWKPEEPFDWKAFAAGMHRLDPEGWTLILEIGRYLTAASGYYVTEVLDVKENHGQWFAVVRGGTHHLRLPAAWKMSHPFRIHSVESWPYPFKRPGVEKGNVTIAGELCTPNDVLVRGDYVDNLRAGDIVIFEYAGAYAWTISHHDFLSHPHPEHVYVRDGEVLAQEDAGTLPREK
ncbi:type III PLP-dependent enzyme [Halobacillus sp. KGW1]|uniref:type III PLP-dependent enzyme n=1 Tax=Halobacillus sp. KGW1 TaxID=1793726 RepID=UPI000785601E|nr:type III PLP-dependent enzyme [Halobacillus sp. KGW1]